MKPIPIKDERRIRILSLRRHLRLIESRHPESETKAEMVKTLLRRIDALRNGGGL